MTVAAIPTTYRGVNMRSRLEAKWAAFFDAGKIPWEYEPADYPGWIPDFRIGKILVDVKPATNFPEEVAEKLVRAAPVTSESAHDALMIIRESPTDDGAFAFAKKIGWICFAGKPHWWEAIAVLAADVERPMRVLIYAYCDDLMPYPFQIVAFKKKDGISTTEISPPFNGSGVIVNSFAATMIEGLWKSACNCAQWKAPA